MLTAIATKLSDSVIRQCRLAPERKNIYIYGSELLISTGLGMLSVLLLSFLLGNPLAGVIFLLIFISLRLFAGGFHASTYLKCFVLSNTVFIVTFWLASALLRITHIFTIGLLFIGSIIIVFLAPIRNTKHPLSNERYKKNRIIARFLSILEAYLILVIYTITSHLYFLSIGTASMFAVSLMIIFPKFDQLRRDNYE